MKLRIVALRLSIALLYVLGACHAFSSPAADIGSKIANFQLTDNSGESWSLRNYAGKTVVLVFWSCKCPISLSYDSRVEELRTRYAAQGIVVAGVASNTNETPEEIRANLANRKMLLPVLLDSEGNLAEKLGATHTPSVFVIDGNEILRYKGAFDNNKKPGESGRIAYVEEALNAILAGQEIRLKETGSFGCGIKQGRAASGR